MTKKVKQIVLFLGFCVSLFSCSEHDLQTENVGPGDESIMMRFLVTTPRSARYNNNTRIDQHDTNIEQIQVLVFEEGKYKYRVPGISVNSTGNTASFTVRLLSSSKRLDFYIIANATQAVLTNEPAVGQSMDAVRTELQAGFTQAGFSSVLPMVGSYRLDDGLSSGQMQVISGVKMLRAIARADILSDVTDGFELTSVQVFRANNLIQLIPARTDVSATVPEVPVDSRTVVSTNAISITANQSVAQLYLPESVAPEADKRIASATCIIVGGKFGGEESISYYRIDFDPDNKQNSFGQVLRNHCYIFTIRSVAGPGWPTPEDAANNRSAQINLNIQDWDLATEDMYFDTEHYFGVSSRISNLGSSINALDTIFIDTDLDDYTLQWADESGNVSGSPAQRLANSYFKVEKKQDGKQLLLTTLQSNRGNPAVRTGYFVITASRWKILITIRQRNQEAVNKIINLLSFNALGGFGVNLIYPYTNPDSRGSGASGILSNLSNFGPTGTVVCNGFNLLQANAYANTISDTELLVFDVLYFNYVSAFTSKDVQKVINWLEGNKRRVLIVSYDSPSINDAFMKALLGNSPNLLFGGGTSTGFALTGKSSTNYFTDTGPFTPASEPVKEGFVFQTYDGSFGAIGPGSDAGITSILTGPQKGITLGVDMSRRIIYIGDVDIFTSNPQNGGDNHINNRDGVINNNASRLIANLFAWVVGVVQGEE